ncbi:hypothetical protein KZO37_21410 [Rhodococcus fascians]|uniref:hypothetical protein n=1 Tax=Rhodococcoides fascians TaxID=1828 RepID=UPI001C5DBA04|nr:hypothetical protein [Rhodococcus fascians]MBW4781923.1 hypothetical protein [Rhodococcus fascians]
MKRADLLKEIRAHAKSIGEEIVLTEGGNHTKVVVGTKRTVLARHNEINEMTVKAIRKQLGMADPRQKGTK